MRKFGLVMLVPLVLFAQELVGEFAIDTNIYTSSFGYTISGFIGPEDYNYGGLYRYRKKGTNQIDIFTAFYQKIGTITIPDQPPTGKKIDLIHYSQKFLDEDGGWEFIVNYYDTINGSGSESFKVIDETGTVLLSDENVASYGCDGQNTYIFSYVPLSTSTNLKVWKFRSNISSASRPLSKTSSSPGPMMAYMPSGDFRVSLQPVTGGTSIHIFDMLGRQIFSKDIQNIREPTSFIIPSSGMPNSPFVAKVNNNNGSFVKKGIPVR